VQPEFLGGGGFFALAPVAGERVADRPGEGLHLFEENPSPDSSLRSNRPLPVNGVRWLLFPPPENLVTPRECQGATGISWGSFVKTAPPPASSLRSNRPPPSRASRGRWRFVLFWCECTQRKSAQPPPPPLWGRSSKPQVSAGGGFLFFPTLHLILNRTHPENLVTPGSVSDWSLNHKELRSRTFPARQKSLIFTSRHGK
jgi:hypothetical protein